MFILVHADVLFRRQRQLLRPNLKAGVHVMFAGDQTTRDSASAGGELDPLGLVEHGSFRRRHAGEPFVRRERGSGSRRRSDKPPEQPPRRRVPANLDRETIAVRTADDNPSHAQEYEPGQGQVFSVVSVVGHRPEGW